MSKKMVPCQNPDRCGVKSHYADSPQLAQCQAYSKQNKKGKGGKTGPATTPPKTAKKKVDPNENHRNVIYDIDDACETGTVVASIASATRVNSNDVGYYMQEIARAVNEGEQIDDPDTIGFVDNVLEHGVGNLSDKVNIDNQDIKAAFEYVQSDHIGNNKAEMVSAYKEYNEIQKQIDEMQELFDRQEELKAELRKLAPEEGGKVDMPDGGSITFAHPKKFDAKLAQDKLTAKQIKSITVPAISSKLAREVLTEKQLNKCLVDGTTTVSIKQGE